MYRENEREIVQFKCPINGLDFAGFLKRFKLFLLYYCTFYKFLVFWR